MALGDIVWSLLSQSSAMVSNYLNEFCRSDNERRGRGSETATSGGGDAETTMRTIMARLLQNVVLCESRHEDLEASSTPTSEPVLNWRLTNRVKTGYVALILCLNISVDPPDTIKTSPCARMECWIDPFSMDTSKALEAIRINLCVQYERWQPKAHYVLRLDPTVDEVKKLCVTSRRKAKFERVLFHYNGHGVPKPTANGEIWVLSKTYTRYNPLRISDLVSWLGTPSIYIFDCSAAGLILNAFMEPQECDSSCSSASFMRDCIFLAPCEAHESLPQSPDFPADMFTSCLTTPIKMALKWFCSRSLYRDLDFSFIDKIPGYCNDRKTLLGELNWIFAAVTDTIAWNVLPRDLFQRLFRQDLLVASLFRNFLLAERIMRSANCSPISYPSFPATHQHHMWDAWDMIAETCLHSLAKDPQAEFQPSSFFTDQLTAFEIWLDLGSQYKKPPEQLPIVLWVLLSPSYQFRALVLLKQFMDMGPWAVNLALSVGIFPYVLKMLRAPAIDLQQILVFIWTKILAFDKSCQVNLVNDGAHIFFIKFLDSSDAYPEQQAMAAFVLTVIMDGHKHGQEACFNSDLIHVCLRHLQYAVPNDMGAKPLLLQWLCLCLGKLWEGFRNAQVIGLLADAPKILACLLSNPQPEVRASAVFAMSSLLDVEHGHKAGDCFDNDQKFKYEMDIMKSLSSVVSDGCPLVRMEVTVAFAHFSFGHIKHLKLAAAAASASVKLQSNSVLSSLPSVSPMLKVCSDNMILGRGRRVISPSSSSTTGTMHSSSLSDDSPSQSGSGMWDNNASTFVLSHSRPNFIDSGLYSQCVLALCSLARDPSPRVADLGREIVTSIGIDQVVTEALCFSGSINPLGDLRSLAPASNHATEAQSSSWFGKSAGLLPMKFETSVSPPEQHKAMGMRRVFSGPLLQNSLDLSLADPLLDSSTSNVLLDPSLLPQSAIYHWSCRHFSRLFLTAIDDDEEIFARRELRERFALDCVTKWQHSSISKLNKPISCLDTKFETGTETALLEPFAPLVIAVDETEDIRIWNYEENILLNSFVNHKFSDKGVSKLCLVNELDESLLLVASRNGNVRLWRDYALKGEQKLVTAFSSIQSHRSGVQKANVLVDWQQQSGYLYASGEMSSIMLWDLDKKVLVKSIPSSSECGISALSASQVHGGQFAAGFMDGYIRLFDVRTPEMIVSTVQSHNQVKRVMGIGFQPGFDSLKIVSASQAGDIQFIDIRRCNNPYHTIGAQWGSLTALAIHRHAPVIARGSTKKVVNLFNLEGKPLGTIGYLHNFMVKTGSVSCLTFHPYQALLAAGATDSFLSIYGG